MLFLNKTQYLSKSPSQTLALGQSLAKKLLKLKKFKKSGPTIIALEGELGCGKTTFIKGLAKGLGIKQKITSPTFILIKRYPIANSSLSDFRHFYHIDCYRIKKPLELEKLGLKKILKDNSSIVAIEWAEKIKKLLPKKTLWLAFSFKKYGVRKIKVIK